MSKRKLIIFGAGDIAQVAKFYFDHDTDYQVVAFTVDGDYIQQDTFEGLPVFPFEEIEAKFGPAEADLFVAVSYAKLNDLRADKCMEAKGRGYRLATYISSKATVWPGVEIGENCFILEDNTIQPFVRIGNGVTCWSGNHVGHHAQIGDYAFITSHVVISGGVEIGEKCFVGVNSTLRDHIKLGRKTLVGAGAIILADTDDESLYAAQGTEKARIPSTRLRSI